MGRSLFTNAVPTTLNGSINNSTTTVVVTTASTWPTGEFPVICGTEIMYCTSRSTNTLTVIRGTEGTAAASHSSGDAINAVLTAGALNGFRLNYLADLGLIVRDAGVSASDDEFDNESFSGWTDVNNGSNVPTITERNHRCSISLPGGGPGQLIQSYMKAKSPSSGDWIQACFQQGRGTNYSAFGLVMANGATYGAGRQAVFQHISVERAFYLREWTNYATWNTGVNQIGGGSNKYFQSQCHMRFVWDSTNNYQCFQSVDGITWGALNNVSSAGTVGTITHMGFHVTTWGGNGSSWSIPYVRYSF